MRLLLVPILVLALAGPVVAGSVLISEVLADPVGRDDGGVFVELRGPPFTDLTGYLLEARNGSGGAVTHVAALDGWAVPADGYLVVADSRGGVTDVDGADLLLEDFDLQNGPESLRLLRDGAVVDALAYGTFGPSHAWFGEGDPVPTGRAGASLARLRPDVDTDDNLRDFVVNPAPSPGVGPAPEPGAGILALLGGLGLLAVVSRRRRCVPVATRRPRPGRG